jgi:2,3-bisphosphoglycerate-dependent phosphoglycerate mutase
METMSEDEKSGRERPRWQHRPAAATSISCSRRNRVIWLARHGETADNADGRVQGGIDTPLNDRGREQARALGEEAARLNVTGLYSSQLARALETARIVGARIGLEPVVDERFAESLRGDWEGCRLADIERDEPEAWSAWQRSDPEFRFAGGESLAEHVARVGEALSEVEEPALVICHGGTVRAALVACGRHPIEDFQKIRVPNAELVELG